MLFLYSKRLHEQKNITTVNSVTRMNLRDVGSETSVNDTVQQTKMVKKTSKMLAQRYKKKRC
jgi:hypothetical protein